MNHQKKNKFSKVNHINCFAEQSVSELMEEFANSGVFGPGRIAEAIKIYTEMINDNATIFLGLAGALVPGGMRHIITDMIKKKMVHVIVTTGANVTHDLVESFGGEHVKGINYSSDEELRQKSIDRIYDAFVSDESFMNFEDHIQPILQNIYSKYKNENNQLILPTYQLMHYIGEKISDEHSFVRAAYENNVPIFIPAYGDSVLGLQTWLFSQMNKILIDDMGDLSKIQQIACDAEKAGTLFLGGGVPKNYIFQSRLMSPKTYDYAIQITMDRVETGGLSGASLDEAISWGKTSSKSKMVTVVADVTISLPLIFVGTLAKVD
ncbi:MAG: deoxyhypusine synthase [Candidatus Heimdallarchaeaceae archaeon]